MNPPNPIDAAIGARIKMRRRELDMSQERLGKLVGVTFQQIQKYEKGTNGVRGSRMSMIAVALETTPVALMGSTLPEETSLTLKVSKEPLLHDMILAFSAITNIDARRHLLALARDLGGRS